MSAQRAARALTTLTGAEWRVLDGQPVCDGNYGPGAREYDAMMKLFPAAHIALAVAPEGPNRFVAQDYDVGELEVRVSQMHP
jgi:hypothetical protein